MKKIVLFAVVAFTCEVQAQNLFSPFRGLAFPRLNAAGIPNPQQPQPAPAPGPQTRGPVSPPRWHGAAVGGLSEPIAKKALKARQLAAQWDC